MSGSQAVVVEGQELVLLGQHAVFWPARNALIVADPHFGKAAVFRKKGIAIPAGTTAADLQRLDAAIGATGADTVVVLGDLVHAPDAADSRAMEEIGRWRKKRTAMRWILVLGNHDRSPANLPVELTMHETHRRLHWAPFTLVHKPQRWPGTYVISGHLHPAVQLSGPGRQKERLPCFLLGHGRAILPSFGSFTGHATLRPQTGDRIFVIADGRVVPL